MNGQATKGSFWELINDKKIEIPKYQREYAQGRDNRRAEGIRTGLVNALYEALDKYTPLELDFIFGSKKDTDNEKEDCSNDKFRPVDGQQRLTILYLLHWYIFQCAEDTDALKVLHNNFSYATRTTSRIFCEKICENLLSTNLGKDQISAQLKDMPWFTGAMGHDPTVKSMLVVIDCIHNKFKNADFTPFAEKLKNKDCPITFYYYDLSEYDPNKPDTPFNVRDLYIKMNARGLALTDFEIFKAELQKTVPQGQGFDLLKSYFNKENETDTPTERVRLIGKFNNEYTNFFFNLINDGKTESDKFDQAMMNFINEIIRADFFCAASKAGVSQKIYRNHNTVVKELSGKDLYNFIKDSGKLLVDGYVDGNGKKDKPDNPYTKFGFTYSDAQGAFTASLKRIVKLLGLFTYEGNNKGAILAKKGNIGYNLFADLFKGDQKKSSGMAVDPLDNNTLPFGDFVARNALYAYLEEFDIPQENNTQNYDDWNRFVWKMVKNTDFKGFDEAVETLRGLREICTKLSGKSLFDVLSNIEKDDAGYKFNGTYVPMGSSARLHFDEELLKAKLIVSDPNWKDAIKDAENHFNSDGEIWFLLDLAKVKENKDNDDNAEDDVMNIDGEGYSLNMFKKAFSIAKNIFNSSKKLNIDTTPFERALLAVGAHNSQFTDIDHLIPMSGSAAGTKKFVDKDFSNHLSHRYAEGREGVDNQNRYNVTLALLRTMVKNLDPQNEDDIKHWLDSYINNASSGDYFKDLSDWKKILLEHDLFDRTIGGFKFRNCFEPGAWGDDPTAIAIYNTQNKRINSGELHSFALACLIENSKQGSIVQYVSSQLDNYLENDFPNRYFIVKDSTGKEVKVGYLNSKFVMVKAGGMPQDINGTLENVEEICKQLGI